MTHSEEEEKLKGNEELPSPVSIATTPASVITFDKEKFLVPYSPTANNVCKNFVWCWRNHVPYAILTASLLEVIFYCISDINFYKWLRFEPNKLHELWRFLTYMLLHEDWLHLVLNLIMQILFAYFLEIRHGRLRILALYLAGGITGVLGATCFHPDLVIGASGGVYALLISHVADIMMNFENMKYKVYRCICIVIIVVFDIAYDIIHIFSKDEPLISWGAHVIGGISGLFLGLALFKRDERLAKTRKLCLFWTGLILYLILLMSLVILTLQIKKCTPSNIIRTRYVYFC